MRSLAVTCLSVFKCAVCLAVVDNSIDNDDPREGSDHDHVDAAVESHALNTHPHAAAIQYKQQGQEKGYATYYSFLRRWCKQTLLLTAE
jgi:hypothetical protein